MASNVQTKLSIVEEIFYNQYFKTKITKIKEEVKQRSKKKRHASRRSVVYKVFLQMKK